MCCTAASACGPARRMSPMWLTSKMPTAVRTAMCSLMIPPPIDAGYSTGMSQPLNSTIFAPIRRWTAFSAVFRMAGASTDDKTYLNQRAVAGCRDGVTDYGITRFFVGSNEVEPAQRNTDKRVARGIGMTNLYLPNCTVTLDPAGTWVPAVGVC